MVNNWLITGGCGFIGTSLIQKLLEINHGINIRVFDNLSVGSRADLKEVCNYTEIKANEIAGSPKGIELVEGDITNFEAAKSSAKGVQCIIHLAANTGVGPSVENPRSDMETNILGTFNLLEAARFYEVEKFIFASSGATIGEVEPPIHEELPSHPVSPYGASKLAGEAYCSSYYRTFGIKTVALRFGNVYGPRSKHKSSVVAKFINNSLQGKPSEIYGDGTQTRDFIFIDDLVGAILRATDADLGGEIFQIATNKEYSVNEVVDFLKSDLERKHGLTMEIKNSQPRVGDVSRNFSDVSKAKQMLQWQAEIHLRNGIKKTVEWFCNQRT